MTYAYHWRKAMAISVCLHIFLVIGAGHLMAGLPPTLPTQEEVLLEIDLVNNPVQGSDSSPSFKESTSLPDMPKSPTEKSPVMPVQTQSRVSEVDPVVTISELSMTATGTLDVSSTSNQSASSDRQKTSSNAGSTSVAGGGSKSGISAPGLLVSARARRAHLRRGR